MLANIGRKEQRPVQVREIERTRTAATGQMSLTSAVTLRPIRAIYGFQGTR